MSSNQRKGLKWLSIVALAVTTAAALLTRAECSGGLLRPECVGAALEAIVVGPTGSTGND